MKNFNFKSVMLLLVTASAAFVASAENYEVNTAPDARMRDYRQGEVIVKFKPESAVSMKNDAVGRYKTAGVSAVDNILRSVGAAEVEPLMPFTGKMTSATPRRLKAHNGKIVEVKDMSKLYRIKLDGKDAKVEDVVKSLNALPEVEFAEPNYLVYVNTAPDDPLYSQQWGIPAVKADALWDMPTVIKKRPVIAILDTGVDINHPDLADNIWTNASEADGSENYDDDNNGFADDIHGWDFVNKTGNIDDYNGHGTHCAGIAGAVGNNGVGVVGANPDALIMPVTVMQSDGTGDVATIIKGIDYAAANGADVISMSFGGYAYSMAEEQALARAYATAVLVAAAGNDNRCIIPHLCPINKIFGSPMFPAAFTFVLGVQASDNSGKLASFSNYDEDGPVLSSFGEEQLYNYELTAPGTNIYSTFPGGKYKVLNGTSMACPLVAGAVSRLISCKDYPTKELLFGDLIHSPKQNVDIKACYDITDAERKPNLSLVSWRIEDEKDADGRYDAGEVINLYPTIRNEWGTASNVRIWFTLAENEGKVVEFLSDTEFLFQKPLSSYAKAESAQPLRFKIADDVVDGRHCRILFYAQCDGMNEPTVQEIVFSAENGVEIGGMVESDLTLEPGVNYIVTKTLAVNEGATLTLLPGTVLKFRDSSGLVSSGDNVIAKGTPEAPIIFTKADLDLGEIDAIKISNAEYCVFEGFYMSNKAEDIRVEQGKHIIVKDVYFANLRLGGNFSYSNIVNTTNSSITHIDFHLTYTNLDCSNLVANGFGSGVPYETNDGYKRFNSANNIFNNITGYGNYYSIGISGTYVQTYIADRPSYYGSGVETKVRESVWDVERGWKYSKFDLSNMLTQPNPECHGVVWKVVVDGYDAQDEFYKLPPLGVGRHKFEVWYSKVIKTDEAPTIAMGVRPPYTQTAVAEDGSWRTEVTQFNNNGVITEVPVSVYTAYLDIKGGMAIDGLNRIYVNGCKDLEYFDIPIENVRFNVDVAAAGSMSTGFMGEAGLGKVTLTWDNQDENVDDILGYNLYRYTMKETTDDEGNISFVESDSIKINQRLIDGTEYVDFDVLPGKNYNYYYKIMRTNMAENSPSKVVSVTPLTASKGDANGSMSVDVADVVTEVSHITGGNPQPFIFEAADINADAAINVLDIVGTVRIILNPQADDAGVMTQGTVKYWFENGKLWVENDVPLAGVQFYFDADRSTTFTALEDLNGFEAVGAWNDNGYIFLAYSMTGRTLDPGKHALVAVNGGNCSLSDIICADSRGGNLVTVEAVKNGMAVVEIAQMSIPSPNPFSEAVTIPFAVGGKGVHNVEIVFSDIAGCVVDGYSAVCNYGSHSYTWHPEIGGGIYFASLYVDGKLVQTSKLIKK